MGSTLIGCRTAYSGCVGFPYADDHPQQARGVASAVRTQWLPVCPRPPSNTASNHPR